VRLTLESYGEDAGGMVHYRSLLLDADYLADVVEIVEHVGTKPGVYVLVSLWIDPSFSDMGWPTGETIDTWEVLAAVLAPYPTSCSAWSTSPRATSTGAWTPRRGRP
jgi:hypothetical protein